MSDSTAKQEPNAAHVAAAKHLWDAEAGIADVAEQAKAIGNKSLLEAALKVQSDLAAFHTSVAAIMTSNGQVVPNSGGGGK